MNRHEEKFQMVLLRKLNVRAASLAIATVIAIAGCLMIFQGLRDDGEIDFKSPFVSGQVRTGFVGVMLVFMSTALTITIIMRPYASTSSPKQSIKVRKGDTSLEWEGDLYYWSESKNILDVVGAISDAAFGSANSRLEATSDSAPSTQSEAP